MVRSVYVFRLSLIAFSLVVFPSTAEINFLPAERVPDAGLSGDYELMQAAADRSGHLIAMYWAAVHDANVDDAYLFKINKNGVHDLVKNMYFSYYPNYPLNPWCADDGTLYYYYFSLYYVDPCGNDNHTNSFNQQYVLSYHSGSCSGHMCTDCSYSYTGSIYTIWENGHPAILSGHGGTYTNGYMKLTDLSQTWVSCIGYPTCSGCSFRTLGYSTTLTTQPLILEIESDKFVQINFCDDTKTDFTNTVDPLLYTLWACGQYDGTDILIFTRYDSGSRIYSTYGWSRKGGVIEEVSLELTNPDIDYRLRFYDRFSWFDDDGGFYAFNAYELANHFHTYSNIHSKSDVIFYRSPMGEWRVFEPSVEWGLTSIEEFNFARGEHNNPQFVFVAIREGEIYHGVYYVRFDKGDWEFHEIAPPDGSTYSFTTVGRNMYHKAVVGWKQDNGIDAPENGVFIRMSDQMAVARRENWIQYE